MKNLKLLFHHVQQMQDHIFQNLPEEACGMLGGRGDQVEVVIPITNQAHSPVRYYMDPVEMLKAFEWLEENHLEMLATFHSHPMGPHYPSETDIQEFAYPGTAMLIWSPVDEHHWGVKGFVIEALNYREIPLILIES
ncbi:MAG: M67 family metallopeptidase [Chloroflexota bacterium]